MLQEGTRLALGFFAWNFNFQGGVFDETDLLDTFWFCLLSFFTGAEPDR